MRYNKYFTWNVLNKCLPNGATFIRMYMKDNKKITCYCLCKKRKFKEKIVFKIYACKACCTMICFFFVVDVVVVCRR